MQILRCRQKFFTLLLHNCCRPLRVRSPTLCAYTSRASFFLVQAGRSSDHSFGRTQPLPYHIQRPIGMVLDGGIGTATAVGSAANISLRLFQVIYEFKAVGQQTRDLLDSTKHVSSTLESARTMRQQKSAFLSSDERSWIDSIIVDTKRCLESVAALVEPARVDLQTKSGRVGFVNRSLFVFRDSPKVATNLARLNLAHQSLNAAMGVLCSKGTYWQPASELQAVNQQEAVSPPSYERDQFLQRGKLPRKGSVSTIRSYQQPQAFLLSDDGEKVSNAYSRSQYPDLIAELEDSDTNLPPFAPQQPAEMYSETSNAFPRIITKDSEGLQVAEYDDLRTPIYQRGLRQVQTQHTEYSQPIENSQTHSRSFSYDANSVTENSMVRSGGTFLTAQAPVRARSKGRAWLESRGVQRS